ncbi:MAG TPA: M56 family metallopeptidase [Terriglobales bacterium]|nr:M56 family metallopeptidase [Terriglobales bacterium]
MIVNFQTVAQLVAARGLNTVIEGLALTNLSWGVLRIFGARSSMTRFAVWFSTLLVIAGLPLLSRATSPLLVSGSHIPELTLSGNWAAGLFSLWALIAGVLLVRLGLSLRHISALRRNCCEIDASSYPALTEVTNSFTEQSRPVKFLASNNVRVPIALGFFIPAVVLPTWALRDLSPDELKLILLHELAHLRRWDDWSNLAQKFVKALFFFHPAVWWIDSRLALEREIACDDMVLEQTANAKTYAASLVSIAEKVVAEKRVGRALALAQSALGRVKEISHRIAQILDTNRTRTTRGLRPALAMIGALSVVTLAAMPYAPELISFQNKTQPLFSAPGESAALLPIKATPVLFKQPINTHARSFAVGAYPGNRTSSRADVIPAKATLHKKNRAPKVMMAKASDISAPAETLVLLHSSQFNQPDSVWTLTVWRVSSASGGQQMIQETIVMNSL